MNADTFVWFAISILYTIILYGAGPLLFLRFRKNSITRGKLKAFSICYTFAVWLGSNIFWGIYADSDVSSGGAAILWGGIFYTYMKRELGKTGQFVEKMPAIPKERFQEQETNMGKFVVDTETGEVVKESNTTCDHHETVSQPVPAVLEAPSRKSAIFTPAICVLSCACLALAACNLWFWNETQTLHTEIAAISEENSKLEARVSDISKENARKDVEYQSLQNEKAELESKKERSDRLESILGSRVEEVVDELDKIGFIVEGSKYYHRFECEDYTGAQEYWAHNVEYCEYLGYSRCPKCWW